MDPICNAYKGIVQESHILPGEDIVIFGVGPIGLFAIQIANLIGCANIIAVDSSANEERFEMAKKYGANHIIRFDKENVIERMNEITKGEKAAVAIDCAGPNSVTSQAIDILRNGGEIIKIGYDKNPYQYSLDNLLERGISIKGHFGYDYISWKNCLKLLELGKIDLRGMISHYIRLEDWKTGFDLVRSRKAIKIIITKEEELLK
jgi:threonine dehydrogenase-like Zn-dependent dehydrogenase